MKRVIITVTILIVCSFLFSFWLFFFKHKDAYIPNMNSQINERSFFLGQIIWRDYLKNTAISYNLDQVIAGMKSVDKGESLPENIDKLVENLEQEIAEKQNQYNLVCAEQYLAKIKNTSGIQEIIQDKLFILITRKGNGPELPEEKISIHLDIKELQGEQLKELYSSYSRSPLTLSLKEAIPGLKEGLKGIRSGEKRLLYIHPDLAYRTGRMVAPNQLIVFEIEAL